MVEASAATDDADAPGEVKAAPPKDRKELLKTTRRQLEWYFSDANLSVDQLLHDQIIKAFPGGWLCCFWLKEVERMAPFHTSPELILEALRGSHLEVQLLKSPSDNRSGNTNAADPLRRLFLRRRQPLPPLLRSECRTPGEVPPDPTKAVLRDPHGTLNRLKDQWRVQEQLQINELGDGSTTFYERPQKGLRGSKILAVGYERVLFGDDGPYVELKHQQVRWEAWPHFHNKKGYQNSYYDEYYTDLSHALWCRRWHQWTPHPTAGLVMLYAQTHPVNDRPWAPSAGMRPHAWREHGYADYRPGYYYLAADANLISATQAKGKSDRAKKSGGDGPACDEPPGKGDAACGEEADGQGPPPDACAPRPAGAPEHRAQGPAVEVGWNVCWNYKAGRCDRGASCKWRHS